MTADPGVTASRSARLGVAPTVAGVADDGDYLYDLMRGRADVAGLAQQTDPQVVDLGHDVLIMFTVRQDGGPRIGFIESHPTPEGRGCSGQVTFDVPEAADLRGPRWTLVSMDPLHIEPSVLCRGCGHHGFVRDGAWVPA